jgi:hypothetical protein
MGIPLARGGGTGGVRIGRIAGAEHRRPRVPALARQADSNAQLVDLWLHGRPETTRAAYRGDRVAAVLSAGA